MSVRAREFASPHHDDRPPGAGVDMIVLHTAPAGPVRAVLAGLCAAGAGRSVHYLVDGIGTVWRLVDEPRRAWHCGDGWWRGRGALDDRSIGIALAAPPASGFPVLQLASLCELCLDIVSRHGVAAGDIVGLGDIAPEHADDPGPGFDWEGLARNGVGVWPEGVADLGRDGAVRDGEQMREVRAALGVIGYRVAAEGAHDPTLAVTLRAFQRHWRPEAVTGQADTGTLARMNAVARLVG